MKVRHYMTTALLALLPATAFAAAGTSLRGSPSSMERQHLIAVDEALTFYRTPGAVLAEVAGGTLIELPGNADYRIANVSYAYAVPEVRMLVERLAQQYRQACGEQLVVTSLTRPKGKQPRNAHELSVHPAGMAVDLRISQNASCRTWLEGALLSLEGQQVLDVTRERMPPHYHIAVFPTPYREYVQRLEATKAPSVITMVAAQPQPASTRVMSATPTEKRAGPNPWTLAMLLVLVPALTAGMKWLARRNG